MGITESLLYMLLPSDGGQTGYDEAFHKLLDEKITLRTIQISTNYSYELCLWTTNCNENKYGEPHVYYGGYASVEEARDHLQSGTVRPYSYVLEVTSGFRLMGILYKNNNAMYATMLRILTLREKNDYSIAQQSLPNYAGYIQYFYKNKDDLTLDSAIVTAFTKFEFDPYTSGDFQGSFDVDIDFNYSFSYQKYYNDQQDEYSIPIIRKNGNRTEETQSYNLSENVMNIKPTSDGTLTDLNGEQLYNTVIDMIYEVNDEYGILTVQPRILTPVD